MTKRLTAFLLLFTLTLQTASGFSWVPTQFDLFQTLVIENAHASHRDLRERKRITTDGSAEYITMGNVAALNFDEDDPHSVSIWFRGAVGGTYVLTSKQLTTGDTNGWVIIVTASLLRWGMVSTAAAQLVIDTTSDPDPLDGQWHQFLITYPGDAATATFYVDGTAVGTTVSTDTLDPGESTVSTAPFQISGRNGANLLFPGDFGLVSIWNKELSAAEAATTGQGVFPNRIPTDPRNSSFASTLVGGWGYDHPDTDATATTGTIKDLSTGGNDGTPTATEVTDVKKWTPSSTPFNLKSCTMNGTDEYVNMLDVLSVDTNDAFSISFWIKLLATPGGTEWLVDKSEASGNARGYGMYVDAARKITLLHRSTTSNQRFTVTTAAALSVGTWTHVMATADTSAGVAGLKIYINGTVVGDTDGDNTLSTTTISTAPLTIGARGSAGQVNAVFDEIGVWTSELSSGNTSTLYGNGDTYVDPRTQSFSSNLGGYWKCGDWGDKTGTDNIVDRSGNGNHGSTANMDGTNFIEDIAA